MPAKTAKPRKAKLGVYMDPAVARELKRERAETDVPVSGLIERIVARHYGVEIPPRDSEPS